MSLRPRSTFLDVGIGNLLRRVPVRSTTRSVDWLVADLGRGDAMCRIAAIFKSCRCRPENSGHLALYGQLPFSGA
jgi:hypothetical protein